MRGASAQTSEEAQRLMSQMREANARLTIAVVQAQELSDALRAEAVDAKKEVEGLMMRLQDANKQLVAAVGYAGTMAAEARQRRDEYRQLSGRLLTLQDEERRRLALELHDSTAQCLAVMTMNLELVTKSARALDARSRRALAESRALAEQCSRDVRTFAHLLHPPLLDEMGLMSALRWYAEGFAKRSGIQVAVDLGKVGRLPRPIETAIFRVVQESLTNVHRHASASSASIRLAHTADAVVLEVEDKGRGLRGLPPSQRPSGTPPPATLGVGIQGMRERIHQLGGVFNVEFTNQGTTVRVGVPLKKGRL
jgi:signal transduction histidine kinase